MLKSFSKSTVSKRINAYFIIYKICPKLKFECGFILHMKYAWSSEYCKKGEVTKMHLSFSCRQQQTFVCGHCSTIHHVLKPKLNQVTAAAFLYVALCSTVRHDRTTSCHILNVYKSYFSLSCYIIRYKSWTSNPAERSSSLGESQEILHAARQIKRRHWLRTCEPGRSETRRWFQYHR